MLFFVLFIFNIFNLQPATCSLHPPDLQILFPIAHVSPWHNLEQAFLRYEPTDFLFLSSRVFLRSCSFDLQSWKYVLSFQEPHTATMKIHAWGTRQPFWFEIQGSSVRIKPTEISSTCHGELDSTSGKFCNSESFRFTDLYVQHGGKVATPSQKAAATTTGGPSKMVKQNYSSPLPRSVIQKTDRLGSLRCNENIKKSSRFSKQINSFAPASHFLVHFFAVFFLRGLPREIS